MASLTTRLLLTFMILAAGVGVARQVIIWWRDDPSAARTAPLPGDLGDSARPHVLQFGDSPWAMERRPCAGPVQAAVHTLCQSCRQFLEQQASAAIGQPPISGGSERTFLASLAHQKPVERQPGQWSVYSLGGGFPLVVGVSEKVDNSNPAAGASVAGHPARMVTWGLGIPTAENAWTLYTFFPCATANAADDGSPEVPLPQGGRSLLAIRVKGGGKIKSFQGTSPSESWQKFYEQWFRENGWTVIAAWQQRGTGWNARFARTVDGKRTVTDVQWTVDGRGNATGLILVTPDP